MIEEELPVHICEPDYRAFKDTLFVRNRLGLWERLRPPPEVKHSAKSPDYEAESEPARQRALYHDSSDRPGRASRCGAFAGVDHFAKKR